LQQQRQQIKDQMGVLEEQIELLGSVASLNEQGALATPQTFTFGSEVVLQQALGTLHSLFHLAQEQQNLKSVPAADFLAKIISILVQDAAAQGFDIAVTQYGTGKISMEMAELVLGAIIAGIRASLKSFRGTTRADRLQHFLFPTFSFYLEVKATPEEIQFRLVDDGPGYVGQLDAELASEKQFQKLRQHIARSGGWFSRTVLQPVGGLIEFKVPLPRSRFETLQLRNEDCDLLLPSSCVVDIIEGADASRLPKKVLLTSFDGANGLRPTDKVASVLIRIGVADVQFWITCDSIVSRPRSRRVPGTDLVSEDSWFTYFGLFHEGCVPRILPLLEGDALIRFHTSTGGKS
jgi:hypothetical protein